MPCGNQNGWRIYNDKHLVYVSLPELRGKCLENLRFEPLKDCIRYDPRDWRPHGHAFNLLVKLSVKLERVYEAMVQQVRWLLTVECQQTNFWSFHVPSLVGCSWIVKQHQNTYTQIIHSFGLTVIFIISSKNCVEVTNEYGQLAVKGLSKPFCEAVAGRVDQGDNHK